MSMMRFASEDDFEAFKKKTGIREARPLVVRQQSVVARTPAGAKSSGSAIIAGAQAVSPLQKAAAPESEIERRFAQQVRAANLTEPERNYYHIPARGFTLDFAWPDRKIGVEIQGMAHRIKSKFHADCEKRALAMLAGWRVLEISGDLVRSEQGIKWLQELMG